jgi:site-specific DNA-methyltransferase (adenine-specific)
MINKYGKHLLGDCLELLKNVADKSVDLLVTDPPYGTTRNTWDKIIDFNLYWDQVNRVMKPKGHMLVFASGNFFPLLAYSNKNFYYKEIIWRKTQAANPANCKKDLMLIHESIAHFRKESGGTYNPQMQKGKPYINNRRSSVGKSDLGANFGKMNRTPTINQGERYPTSILTFARPMKKENWHPTGKPKQLIEFLINTYSNAGDTVLDTCAGSAVVAKSCIGLKRYFISMEKEQEYYNRSRKELEEMIKISESPLQLQLYKTQIDTYVGSLQCNQD